MSVNIPSNFSVGLDLDLNGGVDVTVPTSYHFDIPTDFTVNVARIAPIELSLRLKEIPSIRAHLPLNYKVGFSLLGLEVACIHLCGAGQVITEPYAPYPCEPPLNPAP
jgi:hypothetical protein